MQKFLENKYLKIGILGGSFDPPHKGHLYISKIALKKLDLKKVIWIITKKNPLKKNPYLSIQKRLKLCKKITKKEKKISIKYLDNKVNSMHTFDMLNYIKKINKKKKLFFIIGSDNLANFHKWKNWKKIPKIAKLVIFPRQNCPIKSTNNTLYKSLSKSDWILIKSKKINISSSLIRKFW